LENKGPAFVSYARADSSFAHRLAADLKTNGANVWLDQFDIRLGRHWDREVQHALAACSELLVLLSPASIESDHVMNEVRYALDERKTVIPVLLSECHVPFHLRRLQFVDFREDYGVGLETLLMDLTGEHQLSATRAAASTAVPQSRGISEQEVTQEAVEVKPKPGDLAGIEPPVTLPQASRHRASKVLAAGAASFLVIAAAGGGAYWSMFRAATPTRRAESVPTITPAPEPGPATPAPAVPVVLGDALPIRLTLAEDIPNDAAEGDAVRFRVAHDVLVNDTVVIPTGADATGAIVDGAKKKVFGIGGKMTFRLERVDAVDGQKVNIRATAVRDRDGSSKRPVNTGAKQQAVAATAGAEYLGYTDASNMVMVTKIAR